MVNAFPFFLNWRIFASFAELCFASVFHLREQVIPQASDFLPIRSQLAFVPTFTQSQKFVQVAYFV